MSTLEQFEIFKEVAEAGNITQASKRLHISQPSVSVQIQNLEKEYGAELFSRTNRGVVLTEPGNILYEKAIVILHLIKQVKEDISAFEAHQNRYIHIGATMTIGEYLLPRMMQMVPPDGTPPRFNAHIGNTREIAQEVLERTLSIGLVEGPVPLNEDLVLEQFWTDELVLVVSINHRWSRRTEVEFEELATERFITREEGSGTRRTLEQAIQRSGFDPGVLNVVMELNSTQAIKETVAAGLGVTIISALTVQEECRQKRLTMLRIKNCQLVRPLNIITCSRASFTPEENWFLEQIRSRETLRPYIPVPFLPYPASDNGEIRYKADETHPQAILGKVGSSPEE
ncbi:LysR family transcriptional regulator [Curtanaerobium respiraculi]|uniref:LysR family transcriptional regulator n=1 Tax=Curtanaerobium respiraculi TaxID=2949669 RepID=UPI0024B323D4|nr:LysR family transcriptional regulator [Curtanaerobium respiraculi]